MNDTTTSHQGRRREGPSLLDQALGLRDQLIARAQKVVNDRDDAEDVVHEVFLTLTKYQGPKPRRPEAWLMQVVKRRSIDRLRGRVEKKLGANQERVAAQTISKIAKEELRAAVHDLREPYSSAVRLRYLENCSFTELAVVFDCPERTVRTWVARGLATLRKTIGGQWK